jgi:hypothetical protein
LIDAEHLFRNKDLNPAYVVIAPESRSLLARLLEDFDTVRRAQEAGIEAWRRKELEQLVAEGRTTPLKVRRRQGSDGRIGISIKAPPAGTVLLATNEVDGEMDVQSAPVSSLRYTNEAYLVRQSIILETGRSIVAFFKGSGTLSPARAEDMMSDLADQLAATYR